jgi:hypothetical protein
MAAMHEEVLRTLLQGESVQTDELLPDVLVLPADTIMHDHPLVIAHKLIPQVGPSLRHFNTDLCICSSTTLATLADQHRVIEHQNYISRNRLFCITFSSVFVRLLGFC